EAGRRKQTLGRLAHNRRGAEFRLCLLCHLLLQLKRQQLKPSAEYAARWNRRPALGFHWGCWQEWRKDPKYSKWETELRMLGTPEGETYRRFHPMPEPPSLEGRTPTTEQLDRHFRWLIRHFCLRESWREIGKRDHFHHTTVMRCVKWLIQHLPATWSHVFPGRHLGRFLDKVAPMDEL